MERFIYLRCSIAFFIKSCCCRESILVFVIIIEVEVKVKVPAVVECVLFEARQFTALSLGGTAEALATVYESAYLYNFKQVEFRLRSYVLKIVGHKFRAESVLGKSLYEE